VSQGPGDMGQAKQVLYNCSVNENGNLEREHVGFGSKHDGRVVEPTAPLASLPVIRIHRANIRRWRIGFTLFGVVELSVSLIGAVGHSNSGGIHPAEVIGIVVGVAIAALGALFQWRANRRRPSLGYQFFGRATAHSLVREDELKPRGDLWIDDSGVTFDPDQSGTFSTRTFRWTDIERIDLWSRVDRARLTLTMVDQRPQEFRVSDYDGLVNTLQTLPMTSTDL
jgi:hypothetical protein